MNNLDHQWELVLRDLRQATDETTFDFWLAEIRPIALERGELVLAVPTRARGWVESRYLTLIRRCVNRVIGVSTAVTISDAESDLRDDSPAQSTRRTTPGPTAGGAVVSDQFVDERFNPKYTFDQFVIGSSNRFAHAATLTVAELPAQAFNPLFIYGAPGLGKTHLLHSIGNYLRDHSGGMRVKYMTAEAFTNRFLRVLREGRIETFKSHIRNADILLVDDIQFLENKVRTEEEFFHSFDFLYESGRQLVITCDRMPREMTALETRLRERFESGLVVNMDSPDLALRMTILRKRVAFDRLPVPDEESLLRIAERVPTNIRSLEGALVRVVAYASLNGAAISPDLVSEVLNSLYPPPIRTRCTVDTIQRVVARRFGLSHAELVSSARHKRISYPRQIAMYLSREMTDESIPSIAKRFNREHSTVIYAHRKIAGEINQGAAVARHAKELAYDATSTSADDRTPTDE